MSPKRALHLTALALVLSVAVAKHINLPYRGADLSSLPISEQTVTFKDTHGNNLTNVERYLRDNGLNSVRQRIWVNPVDGYYGLQYSLDLAKRVTKLGLSTYLDFHYSDTWADPGHQFTPAAWANLTLDELSEQLYEYTKTVCNAFAEQGTQVTIVSIGNEINNGILWPTGQAWTPEAGTNFYNFSRLLHAAAVGVKDSNLEGAQIAVHLENGWNWNLTEFFFDTMYNVSATAEEERDPDHDHDHDRHRHRGFFTSRDYDILALSYYPFYDSRASLASLKSALSNVRTIIRKPYFIAETNWPAQCTQPSLPFPVDCTFPFSAEGQIQWVEAVSAILEEEGGLGIYYWEPTWLQNAGLGSSCEDLLFFDWRTQEARVSVSSFEDI